MPQRPSDARLTESGWLVEAGESGSAARRERPVGGFVCRPGMTGASGVVEWGSEDTEDDVGEKDDMDLEDDDDDEEEEFDEEDFFDEDEDEELADDDEDEDPLEDDGEVEEKGD